MATPTILQKRKPATEELNDLIVDSILDIKGKRVVKLDLRLLADRPADFFIICEGTSSTQVRAISENIQKRVKEEMGVPPSHVEGARSALWICMDYFNVVVHIFYHETRAFYELEDLWGDATITEYDSL
ncbi:MAG: ribosome silencing factor [Saprospiraceae bacterium]